MIIEGCPCNCLVDVVPHTSRKRGPIRPQFPGPLPMKLWAFDIGGSRLIRGSKSPIR